MEQGKGKWEEPVAESAHAPPIHVGEGRGAEASLEEKKVYLEVGFEREKWHFIHYLFLILGIFTPSHLKPPSGVQ